jgi:single-strand DNA-binding protein
MCIFVKNYKMNITAKLRSMSATEKKSDKFSIRTFTVETVGEKYPQLLEFQLTNNNTVLVDPFKVGDMIDVTFDLRGREYKGRVWNALNAWKIERVAGSDNSESALSESPVDVSSPKSSDDDLPF